GRHLLHPCALVGGVELGVEALLQTLLGGGRRWREAEHAIVVAAFAGRYGARDCGRSQHRCQDQQRLQIPSIHRLSLLLVERLAQGCIGADPCGKSVRSRCAVAAADFKSGQSLRLASGGAGPAWALMTATFTNQSTACWKWRPRGPVEQTVREERHRET